jgi:hypothetical protein
MIEKGCYMMGSPMRKTIFNPRFFALLALLLSLACGTVEAGEWKLLAPGLELRWVTAKEASLVGDSRIAVVRIDPALWQLAYAGPNDPAKPRAMTARDWAQREGFAVVTNAGMFLDDHITHLGYTEFRGSVISRKVNAYQSVVAFDPHAPGTPPFRIYDLDAPDTTIQSIRKDYASLVQNLRLIKQPGMNRWAQQNKKWSEAALGEDRMGNILFIFSRSPFSMHDFNRELQAAGIDLVAAQHLEGGPEAQIYLNMGDAEIEMFGSYETGFREDDSNAVAWPIPNVLGIKRRVN